MPVYIDFDGGDTRPVASEEELLGFVNQWRAASGQEPLERLLPSVTGNSSSCLIANGVNQDCEVYTVRGSAFGTTARWAVHPPEPNILDLDDYGEDFRKYKDIADALGLEFVAHDVLGRMKRLHDKWWLSAVSCYIVLPEHVGNAAAAFDEGLAFKEYAS